MTTYSRREVVGLMAGVVALSAKGQKHLSSRLFGPGKAASEMTAFRQPLLANCPVFPVA